MKLSFYLLLLFGFINLSNTENEPLNVGDPAPNFEGINQAGDSVSLANLLEEGPVVVTFYRGNWCKFCNKYLAELDENHTKMKELGANLVAISPELPQYIKEKADEMEQPYSIISNGTPIMKQYRVDFQLDKKTKSKYKMFGINLPKHNGNDEYTLPVPATYVIDKNGVIAYKHFDENYKVRAEVDDILSALAKLKK